jgi:hypothetical protein
VVVVVVLYFYPPLWAFVACSKVHFTFTFYWLHHHHHHRPSWVKTLLTWICLSTGGLCKIRQPYNFQKNMLRHHSGNWYVQCVTQELKMLRKQICVTCICMC